MRNEKARSVNVQMKKYFIENKMHFIDQTIMLKKTWFI